MIIEMVMGRGIRVWIDGRMPGAPWDFEEHTTDSRTIYEFSTNHTPGLWISSKVLRWVGFDTPQRDWRARVDRDQRVVRDGPTEATAMIDGVVHYMFIDECWWPLEEDLGPAPKGVQITGGEWVEVDETQVYIRLNTEDTRSS